MASFLAPQLRTMPYLVLGLCLSVALVGASFVGLVKTLGLIIDTGFASGTQSVFYGNLAQMGLWSCLLALASAGRVYCAGMMGETVASHARQDLLEAYLALNNTFHDKHHVGALLAELTHTTQALSTIVSAGGPLLLRNSIMMTIGLTMMVMTSLPLTMLALMVGPLVVGAMVVCGKSLGRWAEKVQGAQNRVATVIQDSLIHRTLHQAFNHESHVAHFLRATQDQLLTTSRGYIRRRSTMAVVVIIGLFSASAAVLLWGEHLVQSSELTPGTLSAFILYTAITAGALGSLSDIAGDIQQAARAVGTMGRLQELLSSSPSDSSVVAPDTHVGPAVVLPSLGIPPQLQHQPLQRLTFDAVSFIYPSRPDQTILRNFSLEIPLPQKVAIVGPSGAGKSTLFNLLLGFYPLDGGEILVNDVPLSSLPLSLRRHLFSWVPQDLYLPQGTLRNLLAWGASSPSSPTQQPGDDLLWRALSVAKLDNFIRGLAQGLDTPVGDLGKHLSVGQRQRLSIARAWLRQAPIMLLDEATSALDGTNQELIYAALKDAISTRVGTEPVGYFPPQPTSLILIAHRLSTVRLADTIVVMENGQLIDHGDHATLYNTCDLYRRLCKAEHIDAG